MTADRLTEAKAATLRAYERARLRMSATHGALLAALAAGASVAFIDLRSLAWVPVTFALWTLVEWRGVGVLRGGRVGVVAGAVTMALPLSLLRRCCKPGALHMMGGDCCSMPGACSFAGVTIGLLLALALPKEKPREAALGMVLGALAVAPLKCSMLLYGEAIGLVAGLAAGVVATTAARALIGQMTGAESRRGP